MAPRSVFGLLMQTALRGEWKQGNINQQKGAGDDVTARPPRKVMEQHLSDEEKGRARTMAVKQASVPLRDGDGSSLQSV